MSHNFKPGDLALTLVTLDIVDAGSVVEIIRRVERVDVLTSTDGRRMMATETGWLCQHPTDPAMLAYADPHLMPLRGDFAPEKQLQREVPA